MQAHHQHTCGKELLYLLLPPHPSSESAAQLALPSSHQGKPSPESTMQRLKENQLNLLVFSTDSWLVQELASKIPILLTFWQDFCQQKLPQPTPCIVPGT